MSPAAPRKKEKWLSAIRSCRSGTSSGIRPSSLLMISATGSRFREVNCPNFFQGMGLRAKRPRERCDSAVSVVMDVPFCCGTSTGCPVRPFLRTGEQPHHRSVAQAVAGLRS